MQKFFHWDLSTYIYFGGYPGPASFVNETDQTRWLNYINDSLIETTISRDVFLMTQINKPILLRRLFQLGCNYTQSASRFGFGQFQSCRNSSISTDLILTILGRLRSANFVALKPPKTQILKSIGYTRRISKKTNQPLD